MKFENTWFNEFVAIITSYRERGSDFADEDVQREYENAQSSVDEVLSPRQPAVFDFPKK